MQHIHIVKRGDNLSGLAKRYGLRSWREIYYARCNAQLRARRPDPGSLREGDQVVIPPDALYYTKIKLQKLQKIRQDHIRMMGDIEREWDNEYRNIKSNIASIDVIGKVSTVLVGIGFMAKSAIAAIKLDGEAIRVANTKIAKTALSTSAKNVGGEVVNASGVLADVQEDPLALALGKTAVDTFFNWTTPSWWASKIDHIRSGGSVMKNGRLQGTDLDQINNQTLNVIRTQRDSTLRVLDEKIAAAERQLAEAKGMR